MRMTHAFDGWMYRGGHPNRLARLLNRGWAIAHSAGLWPKRLATLEVAGRRTGRIVSFHAVPHPNPKVQRVGFELHDTYVERVYAGSTTSGPASPSRGLDLQR